MDGMLTIVLKILIDVFFLVFGVLMIKSQNYFELLFHQTPPVNKVKTRVTKLPSTPPIGSRRGNALPIIADPADMPKFLLGGFSDYLSHDIKFIQKRNNVVKISLFGSF